ncbi:MAG TPA: YceD family protein [Ideonella sp.]|uniref:YceD family protein n=1 Tax=Ideonella sp. TaxID=1929293 RepID=UPI002C4D31E1|nr:YceD family protein [Ideonella sp.]HSI48444.1 YceD family protein [Ideonella sp.]
MSVSASSSTPDPLRLDVAALAEQGRSISGQWPVGELSRLDEAQLLTGDVAPAVVRWQAEGEQRPVTGGTPEVWLHLQAEVNLSLCCQRCLGPVVSDVAVDCSLRFVSDEASAAEMDADSEDDVLALQRWMDLRELVEDELLLALPLVPRHEVCPEPLPLPEDEVEADEAQPNPFAVLAQLRKKQD